MTELTHPNYGNRTVIRPMAENTPDAPPGATLSECPYCGRPCWKLSLETDPRYEALMADATAACTNCALRRNSRQREMDVRRWHREMAEADVGGESGSGVEGS